MMQDNSDAALLRRFAEAGDGEAFSELVGRYQHFVYGACLRVLGNAADAEDIAQECFLRLARRADAVRYSLPGWLHHNATTMSMDERRRQAARRKREQVHDQMKASSNNEATWQETAPHIDKALDELPDDLRLVLIEHFLRRRTQAELAAELGVSSATVSRRVEAGVERLRGKLRRAGVIASAALLASLVTEHAVTAAPATLTAALGKMAIAGVGKATAATGAATGWTGTGVAAATAAEAAKAKIVAIAVAAAVAIGVGVYKLANKEDLQPPAPPVQERPAAAAEHAEDEPKAQEAPKAQVRDPLLAAIPADAVGFVWVPNVRRLIAHMKEMFPPLAGRIDSVVKQRYLFGVTEEVLDAPAAMVIVPAEMPDDIAQMAILLTVPDMEALKNKMYGPDADGIYGLGWETTANGPGLTISMMPYKGFAAFSEPGPYPGSPERLLNKEDLLALAAAGQRTYEPAPEAARLIGDAELFIHFDGAAVRHEMDLYMRRKREGNIGVFPILLPFREAKSIDLALSFDEAGVNLRAAIAVEDDSKIAEYLVPAPGLDKLAPRLPFLQSYEFATWVKTDRKVVGRLLGDMIDGVEKVMVSQAADQPEGVAILTRSFRAIVAAYRDVAGGEGFGVALHVPNFVSGLGVLDLARPQEFRPSLQRRLDIVNKQIAEDSGSGGFEYAPNARVVSSGDGLIAAQIDVISHPRGIRVPLAMIGEKLVMSPSIDNIRKALHTLMGRDDVPVLADQPPAKEMLDKIGLGHNAIVVFDLVPVLEEFGRPNPRMGRLTPAPAAIGLKAAKGNVLRIKAYLSKQILTTLLQMSLGARQTK